MRLLRRFILVLSLAILTVLLTGAWAQWRRETSLFDDDMRHDAAFSVEILGTAAARVWQTDGLAAAEALVRDVSRRTPHIVAQLVTPTAGEPVPPMGAAPVSRLLELPEPGVLMTSVRVGGPQSAPPRVLELMESLGPERAYVATSLRNDIITSLALVLACVFVGGILGRTFIGRPTRLLVDKARRIGAGDLSGPLELGQHDELGDVAAEMNAMCERLLEARERVVTESSARVAAVEQLRHADRLSTVGKLAAGVAHELGTPLAVAAGRAQQIVDAEVAAGDEARSYAGIVVEQTRRMTKIIRQLLDFARRSDMQRAKLSARELAQGTIEMLASIARRAQVSLAIAPGGEALEIEGDEGQLQQVFTNLVVNAIQATPAGGQVELSLAMSELAPPPEVPGGSRAMVTISVHDTGSGMDETTRSRIFEPFFTTKDIGDGTGLGLSVAWGLVRDHNGWIAVDSTVGKGTTFTVALPPVRKGTSS